MLAFLAVSGALARLLAASGAERAAVIEVVSAQAAGEDDQVVSLIAGCRADAGCRRRVAQNVERLRSPEEVRVLRVDWPPRLAAGARKGTARVAWRAGGLPVVQCVEVGRRGNLLAGFRVEVLRVSDPRPREAGCGSGSGL